MIGFLGVLDVQAQTCEPLEGAQFSLLEAEIDPAYDALFEFQETGWLGGDIAHSIVLSESRSLWLFGDTFLGTSTDGVRDGGATIVNGSIAIQNRENDGVGVVEYEWGDDPTGYFAHQNPPSEGSYYWTTNGILVDGELYVFAMNVVDLFTQIGTSVIHVPNWQGPPEDWTHDVTYVEVGETTRMFHSGIWAEEGWVYLMGFDDSLGFRRTVLARIPQNALARGLRAQDYQYWSANGIWSADDDNLETLIELGVTESNLHFEASLGLYIYTLYDVFTGQIYLSTATNLTGPWSEAQCVYQTMEAETANFDVVTYAARLHPELSREPGELILSYMTNSWDGLWPLFTEAGADIYRPRFVKLKVEAVEEPDEGGCEEKDASWLFACVPLFYWRRRRAFI